MNPLRPRRLPVIAGFAAGAVLLLAGPAFAHVTVSPGDAEKGSYTTVNFKVPNERDDASTVKLEVTIPTDHPLASVMPQPVPGWDVKVTTSKLDKPVEMHGEKVDTAVSKVTWSGGEIKPGTFQQFPLSVGQLPENADQLVFKTLQTYSNKEIVRWIEVPTDGAAEPENPAPVLKLVAPAKASDAPAGSTGDDKNAAAAQGNSATAAGDGDGDSGDTTARVLAVVGIVVGAGGIAFGLLAGRRARVGG